MLWRKPLNSGAFLLLLSGLYPAMFLMSKNWYIYSSSQVVFLLIVTP